MCFSGNGAIAHRPRGETLHYFGNRFNFVKRDRASFGGSEVEESADRG